MIDMDSWFFRLFKTRLLFIKEFIKITDGYYIGTDMTDFSILSEWEKSSCGYKFYFRFKMLLFPKIKIVIYEPIGKGKFILFNSVVTKKNLYDCIKYIKSQLDILYSFKSSKKLEAYMFNN